MLLVNDIARIVQDASNLHDSKLDLPNLFGDIVNDL